MTLPRAIAATAMIAGSLLFAPVTAGAHSELQSSQPSAGEKVGGEVEWVYLDFRGAVADPKVTVLNPAGEELSGHVNQPDEFTILFELDAPLSVEGQHIVRFETTSFDGAVEQSALAFTYDFTAPRFELSVPDGTDRDDGSSIDWALLGGVALIILGLGLLVINHFRRSSDTATVENEVGDTDDSPEDSGPGAD